MKNIWGVLIIAVVLASVGCDRKKDPILNLPGSSTTSVTMQCPQFDSRTFPEARAYVLVLDQAGNPLTDFKIGNFTILDNGNPSVLSGVNKVNEPLSVVICLDRSGSMYGQPSNDVNVAAKQFINALGPNDSAEIIDFSDTTQIIVGFTNNKSSLNAAIDVAGEYGLTALYDAIGVGAQELRNRSGRKFMIVLTDGGENASKTFTTKESAADEVNKSGIAAYIIGLGYDIDTASLNFIASTTNGEYFFSPTSTQLAAKFSYILNLMQNLVVVNYRSRENRSSGEISVYLNYGGIMQSAKRRYGG